MLVAGLFAYVTFYMVPLVVGWASGFMNGAVLGVGGGVAIVGAAMAWWFGRGNELPSMPPLWRGRSWFEVVVWLLIICLTGILTLVALSFPARSFDALSYHLSNPISWHQTGRFVLDSFGEAKLAPQRISAESAPNVKGIFPFTILLFTEDVRGTAGAQIPFLYLVVVAVRAIALRIGARPWAASLAALGSLTVPELIFQATEAYSDLVLLSGKLVTGWGILYLWREGVTWRSVVFPAIGFAIMAGAKVVFLTAGGSLGVLYMVVMGVRGARTLGWWVVPVSAGVAALILCVVALMAAPWLYWSWKKYDNPLYPFKVKVGEKVVFEGVYDSNVNDAMLVQFTGVSGKEAYWNTLREKHRVPAFSSWAGGLGAGMFIVGIPSLGIFALAQFFRRERMGERLLLTVMFGLLMMTCPALGVARFGLFQPVFGFMAFAWLVSWFPVVLRELSVVGFFATMAYDGYMTASAIQVQQRPPALVAFNLLSGYTRAAQSGAWPDQYTALDYWREEVSRPGLKLILPPARVSPWLAYQPESPAETLRYRAPGWTNDMERWHEELLEAGGTHLYVQRERRNALEWVFQRPDLFELMIHRLDNHYAGGVAGFHTETWPEDALFVIRPKAEWR